MAALKREDGCRVTDRTKMKEIYKKFYTNLFTSYADVSTLEYYVAKQQALPVLVTECSLPTEELKGSWQRRHLQLVKAGGHEF